jgi:NADPH:quinone reductase
MSAEAAVPKVMKAVVVSAPGPAHVLQLKEAPVPGVASDHVLIALQYAGVGIWDAEQRAGSSGKIGRGTILGSDGSGTIAAVGSHVKDFSVGDLVYAYSYMNESGGFYAEYVSVPANRVGRVPTHLKMEIAGGMPCIALTAQAGLEVLKVKKDQHLLVFGASGGVGSLAVWLGKEKGATVTGTARPDAQDYVRSLGATHAVDSSKRIAAEGFDACLVTANSDKLPEFLAHLKDKAPLGYPNGVEPKPSLKGHPALAFDGEMSRAAIDRLNGAIGSKTIPLRTQVFPLTGVVEAHQRIEQGHVIGKIVLQIHP